MIPYSYNMVDMGGIDLAEANGTVVEGLYNRLALGRNACGDLILYNWKFAGIEIVPSACSTIDEGTSILINGIIEVTEEDVVNVLGIAPPPQPVESLSVTANGTYTADPPLSGFNPVIVAVQQEVMIRDTVPSDDEGYIGQYCIVEASSLNIVFGFRLTVVARETNYSFYYWGTNGIVLVFEDENSEEVLSTELLNKKGWYAEGNNNPFYSQDGIVSGTTSQYYEHSGLPGYFKISMDVPLGLKLKAVRVAVRINSSYKDFWRTFSFDQWGTDRTSILNILSEENLVKSDWSWTTYTEFVLPQPIELKRVPLVSLYYKEESGWVLLK